MRTRGQGNLQRTELYGLPVIELVHDIEAKVVHQVADANRHDDRLIGRDPGQSAPVEMIEMRVRHEDEIDRGQVMNFEARLFEPLDHLQPLRPDRIDQDIDLVGLNQERRVPDPGDANLALGNFRELGRRVIAAPLREKRRDQHAGEKIPLVPVGTRPQPHAGRAFVLSAVFRHLTNNVSSALFRKRNRHGRANI